MMKAAKRSTEREMIVRHSGRRCGSVELKPVELAGLQKFSKTDEMLLWVYWRGG
jgi:hypothetical protein